ncbi:hypothetical protein NLX83_39605 [Allokutzneria sp. A3M-2-11 16]|uniref:hypothetical protein n=1 Tax=Allokutzneria sp. A3M-2-11 16 TaxID=2962043 RepID=UPI0020B79108|nr:hypothetical protein [Allokutzneria sp. A3M-2-11 16]MCP3805391.1 hypothetical protein [Allokutzneria sp. A3M-2-11 16]
MPRGHRPQPEAELAAVREIAEEIAAHEQRYAELLAERSRRTAAAREANAAVTAIAEAARITPRALYTTWEVHGYDYNAPR